MTRPTSHAAVTHSRADWPRALYVYFAAGTARGDGDGDNALAICRTAFSGDQYVILVRIRNGNIRVEISEMEISGMAYREWWYQGRQYQGKLCQ